VRSAAPKLMGIDLKESAKEYEATQGAEAEKSGGGVGYSPIALRSYRVTKSGGAAGATVSPALPQPRAGGRGGRVSRFGKEIPVEPSLVLELGDTLGVSGLRSRLAKADDVIGAEVGDPRVLSDAADVADVVVTNKQIAGKTLLEISQEVDPEA